MEKKNIIAGPPAGFWVRAGAQIMDSLIVMSCVFILSLFTGIALSLLISGHNREDKIYLFIFIFYLGIPCLYFTITTAVWGQTVGKKVFNLRVTRMDGRPLSFPLAFWRWLSYCFSSILLGLGYVMAGIHSEKRALHDLTSDTKVVQVGPSNQALLIIMLVVIPFVTVPVIGILAAIAIPRFAQMLEKSREGSTKGNLGSLKAALSIYYGDHQGKWPQNLEKDLVPKYIETIPPVKATGAFVAESKSPVSNKVTLAKPGEVPTESGSGWLYDPSLGKIYINSTVKDSKNIPYSFYGFE